MTSKDDIDVDDKDFDAFLRREGDLAQRLQELPQAGPSAELDAAILAAAKAELEKAGKLSQPRAAANDAVAGGGQVLAPSFIRRWRIPLRLGSQLAGDRAIGAPGIDGRANAAQCAGHIIGKSACAPLPLLFSKIRWWLRCAAPN